MSFIAYCMYWFYRQVNWTYLYVLFFDLLLVYYFKVLIKWAYLCYLLLVANRFHKNNFPITEKC